MNASETETPADLPRQVPLRRNNGFRMLWIGQLLSGKCHRFGRAFQIVSCHHGAERQRDVQDLAAALVGFFQLLLMLG